jgi:hypothetical protein
MLLHGPGYILNIHERLFLIYLLLHVNQLFLCTRTPHNRELSQNTE